MIKIFDPWWGEFGWEIMSWAPTCRKISRDYEHSVVTSFDGMGPLYEDFTRDFIVHDKSDPRSKGRGLNYPKKYRPDGEHFKYGIANNKYDVLIHARGCRKKGNYNYKKWNDVLSMLDGVSVAFIGTKQDQYINGFPDERDIGLQDLMNLMAGAKVTVGVSSGTMHLASACGCDQVVWGDNRTYFGETLEKRYKDTWNPHKTRVEYICATDFQPEPELIVRGISNVTGR